MFGQTSFPSGGNPFGKKSDDKKNEEDKSVQPPLTNITQKSLSMNPGGLFGSRPTNA